LAVGLVLCPVCAARGEKPPIDAAALTRAAGRTAAEALPSGTIAYAEIAQPKELLATVLDHPLRERLEETPAYRAALADERLTKLRVAVALVEKQIGMTWREAVEAVAAEGVYVGVNPAAGGGAVLLKASDAAVLEKIREALFNLVRGDAAVKGRPDPIAKNDYRGLPVFQLDKLAVATVGPWLIAATSPELARRAIDNFVDGGAKTLATDADYQAARKSIAGRPTAWAYLHVGALREAGLLKKVLVERTENAAAELLFGGLLSTLARTPFATASVYVSRAEARLAIAAPHDAAWAPEARSFYFGPAGKGQAPPPLTPKQAVASVSVYRDLGGMWSSAADLLDENGNAELAKADSNLSTLFAGREFGRDVLGSFRPEIQLVAARQDFSAADAPRPTIKLPAFALAFRLKDAETMQRQLKMSFQNILGFLNIVGAQNGQPPLDLAMEKVGAATVLSGSYLPETVAKDPGHIRNNFSPSVVLAGERFIVASTKGLALELASAAEPKADGASPTAVTNAAAAVDAAVLGEILRDNREPLIAQNMLQKGHDRQAAEKEIDALLAAVRYFQSASLRLATEPGEVKLELGLRLAGGN
jgi:hypothetical protein